MANWKDSGAKAHLEITYCLQCGYVPVAGWIATEFWSDFKGDLAITLTPVKDGRLEITLNGETLYDKKAEGSVYPGLDKVRQLIGTVREKMKAVPV
jgi:selenoprotein W-related protein